MSSSGHHHHGKQSQKRDGVSLIFSFFLSIFLVALMALGIVQIGLSSERGILMAMDDDFYTYLLQYVEAETNYYTLPTGIDPAVLEGVFSRDIIRRDVDSTISYAYHGIDQEPDTTDIEEKLTEKVWKYLEEGGVDESENVEEITQSYVGEIVDLYKQLMQLPGLETVANMRGRILRYSLIATILVAVLAIVMIVMIFRLHHHVHRSLRYVAYATGGAALMCFVVPFALYTMKAYENLAMTPQYFYHFGITLAARILQACLVGAGLYLVVTLVVIAIGANRRKHSSVSKFS